MLRIGVIGYGYWGPNLVRNFMDVPGLEVAAVADVEDTRLFDVRRRYPGAAATTDVQELLDDAAIDAVAVATPTRSHFELGMQVLGAGKHLWLEKPMTETVAQARALVEEAERRGRVLMIDYPFVYTGAVRKIAEIIHGGELGRVYYYDSVRVNLGLFQQDVNVIADLAVHDFSILLHLLREHPVAVAAHGINPFAGTPENLAYVSLFYDSGAIGHAHVSWLAPVKVRQVLIGGSKKMITYDDMEPSEKVKVYDKGIDFTDDPAQIYQMRVGYRTGDMWAPRLDTAEALRVAAEHFAGCIASGRTPETGGRFGLRTVELIEAATASMRARGTIVSLRAGAR
jgi:predicted dehydrogenase